MRQVFLSPVYRLIEGLRERVVASAVAPFGHAPYPLTNSLDYRGDPGLLGPGSTSWEVMADPATFVGGIRGLLIQAAHPEVVAGVGDHSDYRDDPLGRLSRTASYVTATTYGALPEVDQAVAQVNRIHRIVRGVSSRGVEYDADDPGFSAWVHNVLTDSFLTAYRVYGGARLSADSADRFVLEQTRVGALLGSDPMPESAPALSRWIMGHPELDYSSEMDEAIKFLTDPPLEPGLRIGYKILMEAAVATIPMRIRRILGLTRVPGAIGVGRSAVAGLRWAMGYSPTWHLALVRCEAPIPEGVFRRTFVDSD